MKKYIAISLLSIYLITNTELYQLLKVPVLVEHYVQHKSQNKELSFWGFLCMHYNQEFAHDSQDMKLPFKSHDSNISLTIIAFIANPFSVSLLKTVHYEPRALSVYHKVIFKSSVISSIWQPPRVC